MKKDFIFQYLENHGIDGIRVTTDACLDAIEAAVSEETETESVKAKVLFFTGMVKHILGAGQDLYPHIKVHHSTSTTL